MNEIGIDVIHHISLSDEKNDIIYCLENALKTSDVVLITGGLGPTSDDITKDVLCEYFGGQCKVIQNKNGTAAGMIFTKDHKTIVSMPGVPYEMQSMILDDVIPYLQTKYSIPFILHKSILTVGVGETVLAEKLCSFEKNKNSKIKLAYLPSTGKVRLRLTIYGYDNDILESKIGEMLLKEKWTIGTAESCTGGYLSHLISSVSGSSAYYKGSIVSYANEIKQHLLKVNYDTLENVGAVSEQTVLQMLDGALQQLNVDVAIAISGIAGPTGGTEEKPVGTVFIGVGTKDKKVVRHFVFTNNRERNIQLSAIFGLEMLRKFLLKQSK